MLHCMVLDWPGRLLGARNSEEKAELQGCIFSPAPSRDGLRFGCASPGPIQCLTNWSAWTTAMATTAGARAKGGGPTRRVLPQNVPWGQRAKQDSTNSAMGFIH